MSEKVVSLAQRYVLEAPIAEGGMATVWRARDDVLARAVTIKILHPELAADAGFIDAFLSEAVAAARLAHPSIVAIYDTGSEGNDDALRHFIVMEYCGGGSLAGLLAREGSLDITQVYDLATQICGALGYAHREGVVHRDIKPQNILFNEQGLVKVGDFGIARSAFDLGDIDTTTSLLGDVTYISPEQARGEQVDARSDIYSLGAVLYRCLVGRPPFEHASPLAVARAHVEQEAPPLRSIRAHIPRALDGAVLRALQKRPEERYPSTQEFLHSLRDAIEPATSTQLLRRPARPAAPPPGRRRSALIVAGTFAVGALIAVAAILSNDGGSRREEERGSNQQQGGARLQVDDVSDLDPHGDGSEHPDEAPLAVDGDPSTMWTTQIYRDPFTLVKPEGVGLWFDLGEPVEVAEVEVAFDEAGYGFEVRAALSDGDTEADYDLVSEIASGDQRHVQTFDEPVEGRFWLLWLKSFPGDRGGQGAIAEVRFFAP